MLCSMATYKEEVNYYDDGVLLVIIINKGQVNPLKLK